MRGRLILRICAALLLGAAGVFAAPAPAIWETPLKLSPAELEKALAGLDAKLADVPAGLTQALTFQRLLLRIRGGAPVAEWRDAVGKFAANKATDAVSSGLRELALGVRGPGGRRLDRVLVDEPVPAARQRQLRDTWTARWGAPPDRAQMQSLVDDFVREEVLYREALASDLDKDDTIIRRHLAQKVEFLAQGVSAAEEPSEAELQQFFDRHRDR